MVSDRAIASALMENGVEATVSLLAIVHLGALVVPLFSGFGVDAIVARLSAADARIVIASTGFSRRTKRVDVQGALRDAWRQLPLLEHVIWKRGEGDTAQDTRDLDWQETASAGQGQGVPPVSVTPDTPFMVIYTSGTTGKPKGVVHTHGSFPIKIAHDSLVHFDVHPGDVYCWPADMGWIAGTLVLGCALLRVRRWCATTARPTTRLVAHVARGGTSPRHALWVGAHADPRDGQPRGTGARGRSLDRAIADHGGRRHRARAFQLVPAALWRRHRASHQLHRRHRSIWRAARERADPADSTKRLQYCLAGVAADVVNADGMSVTGEVGELAIRAPFVGMTQSFWCDDERYLETYWHTIPGIWVHGDPLRTPDGNYFMMGRSDDTLKVAGKRLGRPRSRKSCWSCRTWPRRLRLAWPMRTRGRSSSCSSCRSPTPMSRAPSWRRSCRATSTSACRPFRPGRVHVVAQLPKTRSSKIMRRVIRSVYCGQPPGDLSSLDNPSALDEVRAAATSA